MNIRNTILKGAQCDGKVAPTALALAQPQSGAFCTFRARWPFCIPHPIRNTKARSDVLESTNIDGKVDFTCFTSYSAILNTFNLLHLLSNPLTVWHTYN